MRLPNVLLSCIVLGARQRSSLFDLCLIVCDGNHLIFFRKWSGCTINKVARKPGELCGSRSGGRSFYASVTVSGRIAVDTIV